MLKTGNKAVLKNTNALENSILTTMATPAVTDVMALNIALQGKIDGGLASGLTQIAGPSKHFKSLFGLILCKAYMDKYDDAVMLFYDSEFGASMTYFSSVGIDPDRVIHVPITTIEEFRSDFAQKTSGSDPNGIKRGEHVCVFVDSVGNLASLKETEDAETENSAADMTRAKVMKSAFRIATPRLGLLDIPMVVINHVYASMDRYAKDTVSGGTGIFLSSNDIWIVGKAQEKDAKTKELKGFTYNIRIEKSRVVQEGLKVPILVTYEKGLSKYSGLFELGRDLGSIESPSLGWYSRVLVDEETGELIEDKKWRKKEIDANEEEFYSGLIEQTDFAKRVERAFLLGELKIGVESENDEDFSNDESDLLLEELTNAQS